MATKPVEVLKAYLHICGWRGSKDGEWFKDHQFLVVENDGRWHYSSGGGVSYHGRGIKELKSMARTNDIDL